MRNWFIAALLLAALPATADPVHSRQWGVATSVGFTMPDYSDPIDLVTNADVTFASGDVKYSCDEAAQVNVDADAGAGTEALPTEEGTVQFVQALTAIQMRCARIHLLYIDTATKVWADWGIVIETYGCHTAQDFAKTIRCGTAQTGAAQSITLDASASSTTDAYVGHPVRIIAGTGAGQGDRTGTAYNGTSKVLTVNAAWLTTPDSTSVFQIDSDKEPIITADSNGVVAASMVQVDGDAGAAVTAESYFDGSVTALPNVTIGTVTTLTGNTVQTGDSYARLGAPTNFGSGATFAANNVDIEGMVDNLPSDPADDSEIDAQLDAIDNYIDSEIAAIITATSAAAIRTAVGLASANIDTQFAGVEAGIAWNSAWDAEAQSEAADALAAIFLDRLLANPYDPSSPPGATDSLLEDLIENDGGVAQFNANALEDAPTGEGESLSAIAEAVWEFFIEGSVTAKCAMAISMAEAAGNYLDSGQVRTFYARDGTTTRIIGTMATDGTARTATSLQCADL